MDNTLRYSSKIISCGKRNIKLNNAHQNCIEFSSYAARNTRKARAGFMLKLLTRSERQLFHVISIGIRSNVVGKIILRESAVTYVHSVYAARNAERLFKCLISKLFYNLPIAATFIRKTILVMSTLKYIYDICAELMIETLIKRFMLKLRTIGECQRFYLIPNRVTKAVIKKIMFKESVSIYIYIYIYIDYYRSKLISDSETLLLRTLVERSI